MRLTEEERSTLQDLLGTPRVAAAKVLRASRVLQADVDGPGGSDPNIGAAFAVGVSTVQRRRGRGGRVRNNAGHNGTVRRKPASVLSPAAAHRRGARVGPSSCSPTRGARWTAWTTSAPRRCGRREQKRAQAVAEAARGHASRAACRLRRRDGGGLGGLAPAARPATPRGGLRCSAPATGAGNAHAHARGFGSSRHHRLRVRAARPRAPVHEVCTAGGPAGEAGHGAAHGGRRGSSAPTSRGCVPPQSRSNNSGTG
jgi:hypothetical protein